MSQSTQKFDIDNQQLSLAGSDLSISKGNTITLPLAIPTGGTSGQLLAKQSDTNYDVTWVNEAPASSYTSVIKHKVKAGESLTKGQAVYVSSASGTNMVVTKASNTSEATSSKTMGLIAQTLANNGQGDIIAEGLLSGLNTNTATIGDPVWLGTNGNLIYGLTNKPYAPAHLVFIGIVTRVSATVGEIFVKVQNGFELNEIHDVDLKTTAPVNGDILGYNGTLWVNKSITALGGQAQLNGTGFVKATGTTISYDNSTYLTTSSAASTYLPIANPTSTGTLTAPTITNSLGANFATSSGNVGIGTATPLGKLDVSGTSTSTDLLSFDSNRSISVINTNTTTNNAEGILFRSTSTNGTTQSGVKLLGVNTARSTTGLTSDFAVITNNDGTLSEKMRVTSGGNVLVGTTTNTGEKLQVNGTAKVTGTTQLNGNVGIGAVPGAQSLQVFSNTNDIAFQAINGKTTGSNYAVAGTASGVGGTLNMGGFFYADGATTNHGIRVFNITASANNYALFIDSPAKSYFQGSVGIGTTAPNSILHTIGTIQTSSTSSASSSYANRFNNIIFSRSDIPTTYTNVISNSFSGTTTDQTMNFEIGSGASTRVTALTLLGNGNVGIGTTTPTSKLQVVGLPTYESNALALAGGLTAGAFYRTSMGVLMVTF
jgi:hypothetical protein